jgi:citrate lyase subunit beta/citryl-CoA lyase
MAETRLRRSLLMTPGNRPERLAKAFAYAADCVVFDLEDSVPPDAKAQARASVAQAVREVERHGRELCVRINALGSGFGADDLAGLPLAQIDSIMLPKVESAAGLLEVERVLAQLGADRGRAQPLELIVMLETPRGVLRALEIAEATQRTTALFFGSGDYTAATGAAITATSLLFARSAIVAAAGATGMQAIDAAYFLDVKSASATREDALAARELGFAGKVVFHPVQVGVANEVFSPTHAEIARAERLVSAYREALARGHGTAVADGVFVAVDLVAPAEKLLRLASLARERDAQLIS